MGARVFVLMMLLGAYSAAESSDSRPLWAYHNGNTLTGYNTDYQNGYIIGVIDGYLAAHQRLNESTEGSPVWLDNCVSAGWPAPQLAQRLRMDLSRAYRDYKQPAAQTVLQHLESLCAKDIR